MTIFHFIVCIACLLAFVLGCVIIFIKVKQLHTAIACYFINILIASILMYSLFLTIEQYTKQAEISNVKFIRNLRTESVIISGRVTNKTKFDINKCFLELTITNKVGGGEGAFKANSAKNVQRGSNSVHYDIQIIKTLPGNTYKDFQAQIPFPPQFVNVEFYHLLHCI